MAKTLLALSALCLLAACSQVKVMDYQERKPKFVPEVFFTGQLTAHGVIKNRSGKVTRTFNADIEASWHNDIGTLDEDFTFNDGEKQQRIWTLTPVGENTYIGTAGDVVGDGTLTNAGNSLFLKYVLRVPYKDGSIDVTVDDRMYLVSPDVVVNESKMTKFGFRVGSILLTIVRQANAI